MLPALGPTVNQDFLISSSLLSSMTAWICCGRRLKMPDFGWPGSTFEQAICGELAAIPRVDGLEFGLPDKYGSCVTSFNFILEFSLAGRSPRACHEFLPLSRPRR
jgi:hypothetical protein